MSSAIACPGCQHQLTLPDDYIGKRVQCPKCLVEFPAAATVAPLEIEPSASPTPTAYVPTAYVPTERLAPPPPPASEPPIYCIACGLRCSRRDVACPSCGHRIGQPYDPLPYPRPRPTHVLEPINGILALIGAILIPIGVLVFLVGPIISNGFRRPGSFPFVLGVTFSSVGILIEIAALILCLVWLYQAWRMVSHGDEEYSPGLMAGLVLVPIFNFYWIFRAIPGLSLALQREAKLLAPKREYGCGWAPGMIACILALIPYGQPFAVCMFIGWMLLANNAAQRLIRLSERNQAGPLDPMR